MRHTNRTIVIVVLVLAILSCFAYFFLHSGSFSVNPFASSSSVSSVSEGSSSTSAQTLPGAVPTQIVKYEPTQPASSTPVKKGSCWTNSIAAPFRGDAWRCSVGNNISDPCFQIPGSSNLLCGVNPGNTAATSSVFVLQLTQSLPKSQPVKGLQPADQVWLIKLQGGTLCSPFTGTLPFTATGEAASYGCAPGSLGDDVMIFNINASDSVWTADIGTFSASTSSLPTITTSSTVPIVTVWQ